VSKGKTRGEYLIPFMLLIFVVGRKGVSYLQLIPGLYYAEIFLLAASLKAKITSFYMALKVLPLMMCLILFAYGLITLTFDLVNRGGISAAGLKNFALVYYPVAALVGYAWAISNREWMRDGAWIRFLGILFLANGLFSLTYPFQDVLRPFVWEVSKDIPILFTYPANTIYLPAGLFFFFLVREVPFPQRILGMIVTLTGILLLMERAVFVSTLIATMGALYFSRSGELKVLMGYLAILIVTSSLHISLFAPFMENARIQVSLSGYLDLFLSIFGDSDNPLLSGTRWHRFHMWGRLLSNMLESDSVWILLFGTGFNSKIEPVIDALFRAPHNSFLHILWRTGIVGLVLTILVIGLFFRAFAKMLNARFFINKGSYSIIIWALSLLIIMSVDSMFGTMFENPYASAPLFFILGVCLTYGHYPSTQKRSGYCSSLSKESTTLSGEVRSG